MAAMGDALVFGCCTPGGWKEKWAWIIWHDFEGGIHGRDRAARHMAMGVGMKIGEAQQMYREQVRACQEQRAILSKQLDNIRSRMGGLTDAASSNALGQFGREAAVLEIGLDQLKEKQEEYQEYLSRLSEQYCAYWNANVARQQSDAAQEYVADMGKIMEVARRLMRGAVVPASDEKKLMEFSMEMYQTAKNIGAMVERQKREKYDTLWGEEEEKEYDDPQEAAENAEAVLEGPQVMADV